jgi:hypothetical protein
MMDEGGFRFAATTYKKELMMMEVTKRSLTSKASSAQGYPLAQEVWMSSFVFGGTNGGEG